MLVLRITAFGLVRAASHPAWCGTPLFALFADAHLPALLHALATASPGTDTWISDLEMAPVDPDAGVAHIRGRVDVCLRKCDAGEVALALVPAASQWRAPVLPRMTLPRKVSLGSAVAAIKAEAAAAPLSPAASVVSVATSFTSECGMVSDRDEDWEFDEEEEEDEVELPVLRTAPTPTLDAIGCAIVVPSRTFSATQSELVAKTALPTPPIRVTRPASPAVRHWPVPARRPAAPSPTERELEEVVAALGHASLARTVSIV